MLDSYGEAHAIHLWRVIARGYEVRGHEPVKFQAGGQSFPDLPWNISEAQLLVARAFLKYMAGVLSLMPAA